jgi:hypothetical protein
MSDFGPAIRQHHERVRSMEQEVVALRSELTAKDEQIAELRAWIKSNMFWDDSVAQCRECFTIDGHTLDCPLPRLLAQQVDHGE